MCRFSSKNDLPKYCDTLPPAAKSRKLFKTFSHGCEVFSIVMWCQINRFLCIENCLFSPFLGEKCKICESRSKPPYDGLWCFTLDTKHLEFSRRCLFQVNCKAAAAITYINLEFTKLGNLWFERRGELFARNCIAIGFLRIPNQSSFEVDEPDYTRVRRLK